MKVLPTYCIFEEVKLLVISVAPGSILRATRDDSMADSIMIHLQPENRIHNVPKVDSSYPGCVSYIYSCFFLLCPYLHDDKPPRTFLASGQTVQAICAPWAPATAKVSSTHESKPLVATQLMREIQADQEANPGAIWDKMPGEDLMICYLNLPENYEDSMIISSAFADRGGFSTFSTCTYRLLSNDTVPEVGEQLCGKKHQWWKNECATQCICRPKHGDSQRASYLI